MTERKFSNITPTISITNFKLFLLFFSALSLTFEGVKVWGSVYFTKTNSLNNSLFNLATFANEEHYLLSFIINDKLSKNQIKFGKIKFN